MTDRQANILAAACAAFLAFAFLAVSVIDDWINGALDLELLLTFSSLHILLATMTGAALSSWWFFPRLGSRLGQRSGWISILKDLGYLAIAVVSAAAIGGTLVFPGFGTLGVPVFLYLQVTTSPISALTLVFGLLVALVLSRRVPSNKTHVR